MFRLLAKISLLVFAVCFYGVKGEPDPDIYQYTCSIGFAGDGKVGVCRMAPEDSHETNLYTCPYEHCWADGNKWVAMGGCQLIGSNDKGNSDQKCVLYRWDSVKKNWVCTNSGGNSYTCNGHVGYLMLCTRCTEIPKS